MSSKSSMSLQSDLSPKELQNFGYLFSLIMVSIFGLLLPLVFGHAFPIWPWIFSGVISSIALVRPSSLKLFYKYWMIFGGKLGWINTRILLGAVFFLVFVPIGVVMRLFGYDPLKIKSDPESASFRVVREDQAEASSLTKVERMENPY